MSAYHRFVWHSLILGHSTGFTWHETIAALQRTWPRTADSADELDKLPVGTVVREVDDTSTTDSPPTTPQTS